MTSSGSPQYVSPLRLAVLLLAAGEGSRLGSRPKALIKKNEQSLLECFLGAVKPFAPVELVLLSGFHANAIEPEAFKFGHALTCPITIIRNPNPERGQASSIRLGLESLKSDFDILLVALSDQPNITHIEIALLLETFNQRALGEEMVLPMVNGRRGNPVVFSRRVIQNILGQPNLVCRTYMDAHPEEIHLLATSNTAFVLDVDTTEDIQNLGLRII